MSFQPRSSCCPGGEPKPPKPCGRMAGRAVPLRASSDEESDASGFCPNAVMTSAHHSAAEATHCRARYRKAGLLHAGRREYGAAEILLEPIGDIGPERLDLLRGTAIDID